MNFLIRASCVLLISASALFAQQQRRIEDPNLEDYVPRVEDDLVVYVPKNAVRLGIRALTGASAGFSGQGLLSSSVILGEATGIANRSYHDGRVFLDTRTVLDPGNVPVPITPDGRTNNWGYQQEEQVTTDGLIMMHAYEANVTDLTRFNKSPGMAYGLELTSEREMGNLFGTRMTWGIVGGVGVNQILATTKSTVAATIKTTTDYYSLGGQAPPAPPFEGPTAPAGVDTTPLLWSEVLHRAESTTTSSTAVLNSWRLRGAYMTFRAGPSLMFPITQRFSATISAGGVLVYAGSSYEVQQVFTPETGNVIGPAPYISDDSAFLPGFYVDANLQYDFTDNAGLYLGAVYQNSGSYTQEVRNPDETSTYKARVDLASLQGIRAGVSFKF